MPIKVKDHDKCKEWERRRRDRLNDAFKNLAQLLPNHDPAHIPPKIDILEKSTQFVKELRLSNSRLLSNQAENDEKCKLIKELQDEVNKLILRVKQLTVLLRKANITIPTGPELKSLGNKKLKWSGKIKADDVENTATDQTLYSNNCSTKSVDNSAKLVNNESASTKSSESDLTPSSVTETAPPSANSNSTTIIIPLKETNAIKTTTAVTCSSSVAPTASSLSATTSGSLPISNSVTTPVTLSPLSTQKSVNNPPILISSSSSPLKLISTEPIFTTNTTAPIQLPVQTFILAPTTGGHSQILTRIALPAPLLPKPLDGISFQKIPIRPVLKPIPRVIKRRKRRTKKFVEILNATASDSNVPSDKGLSPQTCIVVESSNNDPKKNDSQPKEIVDEILSPKPKEKTKSNESSNEDASQRNKDEIKQTSSKTTCDFIITREVIKDGSKNLDGEEMDTAEPETIVEDGMTAAIPVLRIIEEQTETEEAVNADEYDILSSVVIKPTNETVEESSAKPQVDTSNTDRNDASVQLQKKKTSSLEIMTSENHDETIVERSTGGTLLGKVVVDGVVTTLANESGETFTLSLTSTKIVETTGGKGQQEDEDNSLQTTTWSSKTGAGQMETNKDESHLSEEERLLKEKVGEPRKEKTDNINDRTNNAVSEKDVVKNVTTTVEQQKTSSISASTSKETGLANMEDVRHSQQQENATFTVAAEPAQNYENEDTINSSIIVPLPVVAEAIPVHPSTPPPVSKLMENGASSESRAKELLSPNVMENTVESVTTSDKISECIARSIDLIDANDSELMELGEHWEDPCGSPKTPISPTQMFLNMFPLLPRESLVSDHQHAPHQSQSIQQQSSSQSSVIATSSTFTQKSASSVPALTVSSSSRSSFFIDAMLPDDNQHHQSLTVPVTNTGTLSSSSVVEEMGIISSHVSSCLPLTPPHHLPSSGQQISSPFSMSSNFYWTPTPTSAVENSFDFRSVSNALTAQRVNDVTTTTSTSFSTLSSSVAMTINETNISSVVTTTSAPHPVVITSPATPSKVSVTKAGKSTKSTTSSKQASNAATSLSSKNNKTLSVSTSATTTSVTWTMSAPTQISTSSYTHHHPHIPASSTVQSTSTSTANVQPLLFGHSGSGTAAPQSSCSLLDSLNPMDASFFRPLINALDSHDFRTLDFTGPPPPLPPLIPPPAPSAKSLYSSQFNAASNSSTYQSHSIGVNYHTEDHLPSFIHPHTPMFGNTGVESSNSSIGSPKKHQNSNDYCSSRLQPQLLPLLDNIQTTELTFKLPPQTTNVDVTASSTSSRTTGRQKAESSKTRAGKSSRTQPYIIPTNATGNQIHQEISEHPISSQSSSFTANQNIQASESTGTSTKQISSKSYSYQGNATTATGMSTNFQGYHNQFPAMEDPGPPPPLHQPTKRQSSKVSSSDVSKSQKSKDEKAKGSKTAKASNNSKASYQTQKNNKSTASAAPLPVSTMQTTNHSVLSLSQQPTRPAPTPTSSTHGLQRLTETSSKSSQNSVNANSMVPTTPHSFQFHSEPFQLFPDGNNSGPKQVGTYSQHSQYQDQGHSQSQNSNNVNVYSLHKTPAYYLPEAQSSSSFEDFTPIPHQHHRASGNQQPTLLQPTQSHANRQDTSCITQTASNNTKFTDFSVQSHSLSNQQPAGATSNNQADSRNQNGQQLIQSHQQLPSSATTQHANSSMSYKQPQQQHRSLPQGPSMAAPTSQSSNLQTHRQPHGSISHHHQHHRPQVPNSRSIAVSATTTSSVSNAPTAKPKSVPQQTSMASNFVHTQQQQQQASHSLHQHQHQPPSIPNQQPTRSSSRTVTVNWMTDTGYRANNKQPNRQDGIGAATNSLFSVSKLVGTGSSGGQTKNLHGTSVEQQQQGPAQRSANNLREKSVAIGGNTSLSNSSNQSQSSYCAEALIRKNPASATATITGEWNEISFGTNPPSFQGYSSSTNHHSHHHNHHSQQNPSNPHHPFSSAEDHHHFPNYAQYNYPSNTNGSNQTPTVASHFTPFDYHSSQSQQFHGAQHLHPDTSTQGYHSSTSTQSHHVPQQVHQQHHPPSGSHPHHQNQFHYQGHHHHHPHQSHGSSSTSSVSNFNLSTIFPEINDKRSGSSNTNSNIGPNANTAHGTATASGNVNTGRSARGSGVGPSCSYQHSGFGNQQAGNGRH